MTAPDESRLEAAYRALVDRESGDAPAPEIPAEVLQQLAEGTYVGPDRDALIDRALSHDASAREFAFFLDLHNARPQQRSATSVRRWALAASMVVVAALGVRWLGTDPGPDPLRSSVSDAVAVLEPADGAVFDTTVTFAWRPVPDASSYLVEVVRDDGTTVATTTTGDTTASVLPTMAVASGERLSWWVTATLSDGTSRRSTPAALTAR